MTNETTASERERLKPCPFCGGPARWGKCVPGEQEMENDGAEYIECEKCGASTCLVFPCMDSAKPVLADRWNARAALPAPADQPPSQEPQGSSGSLSESGVEARTQDAAPTVAAERDE